MEIVARGSLCLRESKNPPVGVVADSKSTKKLHNDSWVCPKWMDEWMDGTQVVEFALHNQRTT